MPEADALLSGHRIARVAADPPVGPFAPGGWRGFEYWRLHGSPKTYRSDYDEDFPRGLAERIGRDAWTIFHNTTLGHAVTEALALTKLVAPPTSRDRPRAAAARAREARRRG